MHVIEKWLNYAELDKDLRKELENMSEEALKEAFYTDLSFGTGGIRGIIGPGTNRMNIYTLRKVNYGFGNFILKRSKTHTVVIAYDSRRLSDVFALESARVLATMGIKVYLFKTITPTPVLSFSIRYLQTGGGIVITASHNPKIYNGYKVYDNFGCQLLPASAANVMEEINKAPNPFNIVVAGADELKKKKMIEYLDDTIYHEYLEKVKTVQVLPDLPKSGLKVVFTPLHGTAARLGERLLGDLGYEYYPVKEQMLPDPEFSTVPSPNPETLSTFAYAIKYAQAIKADVCVATDPDADRIGVVVRDKDEYKILSGNQTGAVMLKYLAENKKTNKPAVLINTIVTSELGSAVAQKNNIEVVSTLTGFKYIGEKVGMLPLHGKEFLFAYEESNGYLLGDFVRDKDAFQGMVAILETVNYYRLKGMTLIDVLNALDHEYGYYRDELINLEFAGIAGLQQIGAIMNHFRTVDYYNFSGYKIIAKEDYLLGERTGESAGKLTLPQSDVIKYYFDDGDWLVFRPSGTEPKMKVYFSLHAENQAAIRLKLDVLKREILTLIKKVGK
ncbi:MAG: phospho-sugar mutase [Bacilli bacterium]|nr:phospho-sugar mutase [Bacilli bacterium]